MQLLDTTEASARMCFDLYINLRSLKKNTGSRKNETVMLKKLNVKACRDKQYHSLPSLALTVHPSYMALSCFFQDFQGCCVVGVLLVSICTVAEGKMTWLVEKRSRTPRNQSRQWVSRTVSSPNLTQMWTRLFFTCWKTIVMLLRLFQWLSSAQHVQPCQSSVGGWPWWTLSLVLATWDSRAFEQLSCNSLSLQQRSQ